MADAVIGQNVLIYKHDTDTNTDIPFACLRNCTLSIETDEKITTSQASAFFEESKPNMTRWNISGDGMVILNDQWNYLEILGPIKNREVFQVKFVIDNGTALGLTIFSGNCWFSTCEIASPYDEMATYSISMKGSGEYSLTGTTVTPSGIVIVGGSALQVKQATATEGQTAFTVSGGIGLDLMYASRGASVIAPNGSAGDYNEGITWNSVTGVATIYTGATAGERFIFLIQ